MIQGQCSRPVQVRALLRLFRSDQIQLFQDSPYFHSVDIDKFIILPVREIEEGIVANPGTLRWSSLRITLRKTVTVVVRLLVGIMILSFHTVVLDLGGFAILHPLAFLQLIEEHEVRSLEDGAGCQRHKDREDRSEARAVLRFVF